MFGHELFAAHPRPQPAPGVVDTAYARLAAIQRAPLGGLTAAGQGTFAGLDTTAGGVVSFNGIFISANTTAIFGTTGAGSVFIRPNGAGSASKQVEITSAGAVTINGTLTVTG